VVSPQISDWDSVRKPLEQLLPGFLSEQRWFGGKTRPIQDATIIDIIPVPIDGASAAIHLVRVNYEDEGTETYAVPLAERPGTAADQEPELRVSSDEGRPRAFADALRHRDVLVRLLDILASSARLAGVHGEVVGLPTPALPSLRSAAGVSLEPSPMKAEQSNTSILYGRSFVLKFFRHVVPGINPDCEIGEFLSIRAGFSHVPPAAGSIEYRRPGAQPATIGILQGYVENRGDAWRRTLSALGGFYDGIESGANRIPPPEQPVRGLVTEALRTSDVAGLWLGEYGASAYRLGRRTGELHLALAVDPSNPDFRPEPLSPDYQQQISESMIRLSREAFGMLRRRVGDLPGALRPKAHAALAAEQTMLQRFQGLAERPLDGLRTRIHGDLHLGQILDTGDDFVFIDFEGEPARSLAERRAKHSPLRDVAGMLRSFHYAAYAALFNRVGENATRSRSIDWAAFASGWRWWACVEFLRGYLEVAGRAAFLPKGTDELESFLNLWLLDKAMYELKYELNHRLGWVAIPLEGICDLAERAA
jgi:trehalose synthase-fused probable maltokinase